MVHCAILLTLEFIFGLLPLMNFLASFNVKAIQEFMPSLGTSGVPRYPIVCDRALRVRFNCGVCDDLIQFKAVRIGLYAKKKIPTLAK